MLRSALLPFSHSQALSHVTATIKGLFTFYYFPIVWWGAETVLLSYVPDPFLPRDDVIAKWRQEWVGLRQTKNEPTALEELTAKHPNKAPIVDI